MLCNTFDVPVSVPRNAKPLVAVPARVFVFLRLNRFQSGSRGVINTNPGLPHNAENAAAVSRGIREGKEGTC